MNNESLLCWMQNWFHSNCNGDWEHNQNIIITTIDNPGWGITINLEGSNMEGNFLDPIKAEKDENDWYYCKADGKKFEGDGGPGNLVDILKVMKSHPQQAAGYHSQQPFFSKKSSCRCKGLYSSLP